MSTVHAIPIANRLLAALPRKDYTHLLTNCEQVELTLAEELNQPGQLISYVYFPINSFISLITPVEEGVGLEVGLIGNEGMFGATLMLGVKVAPFRALVQGSGCALRIAVPAFLQELKQNSALQKELKRYLYVLIRQLAQTAACNRFHIVEARLARWLLMTQDRSNSDTFHITHTFLSYILGVRRVGITKAAHSLQKRDIINYRRGNVTVLDRHGLEAVSCSCYETDKETYQRVMGVNSEN